ncbi:MAG: aldo/keto reductase [Candidatus Bathyarchaeota archaeon B26-2]|nr:MAG: aldo/keto reductase [Candidatus Bathyarchaeota archaeon B26-2]
MRIKFIRFIMFESEYLCTNDHQVAIFMKYRKFGRLDWEVSALGFGAMRLPVIGGDPSRIDEPEAIRMIRYAVDHGVNYIDTAYPYHGGNSEIVVGKALRDGYREKVRVATKMPIGLVNSREDLDRIFDEQLKKLQTDHIDFYLLHGLNRERWAKTLDLNVLDWAEKVMAEGKIGYLGFSFHDEFEVFKEIIDGYDGWTFCQILYNYIDEDFQAGKRGLKYAASKGLAVVVMEPIAGGMLAVPPPPEIQAIWNESEIKRTPAEWALQWVWNHPEVSVALSGMSTMEQVVENIKSADRSGPNILTEKELELISRVREKYRQYGFIGCTGCRYCMPCPQGVSIPEIFALYNEYSRRRREGDAQREIIKKYQETIPPEKGAKICVKCGECEEKCPQQLPIRNLLARAARIFERNR